MSSEKDKAEETAKVISVLRSLLNSRKPPTSVQVLMKDYEDIEGKVLDYKRFKCQTLKEFLMKSGEFKIEESYNQVYVTAKQRKESQHITELVRRQKRSKRTPARLPRRPISSDRNWNRKNKYTNSNRKNINGSIKSKGVQRADRNNNFKDLSNYRNKCQVNEQMKGSNNANIHTEIPKRNYQSSICLKSTYLPEKRSSVNIDAKSTISINHKYPQSSKNPSLTDDTKYRNAENKNNQKSIQNRIDFSNKFIQSSNIFKTNKTNEKNDFVFNPNEDPVHSLEDYCAFHKINKPKFTTIKSKDTKKFTAQCIINDIKYGTYPNEYYSETRAIHESAREAIKKIQRQAKAYPICEDSEIELVGKIHKMLSHSSGGIFCKNIPDFFIKTYNEKLPDNWFYLIEFSSLFNVEETIGSNLIVFACNLPTDKEVSKKAGNSEAVSIPELEYQWDEDLWDVNVIYCVSTVEIWARIIGENYSEQFDSMMNEIELFMMSNKKLALHITVGEIYLVSLSECWHRVRVIKKSKDTSTFLCFFIDFGDIEWVSMTEIFVCEAKFLKLAPQAVKFSLDGLEAFADNQNITLDLMQRLIGKSFIGQIITTQEDFEKNINSNPTKYSPIEIILYDTSTPKTINVNYLILKEICNKKSKNINTNSITSLNIDTDSISKDDKFKNIQSSSYLVSEVTSAMNDLKMSSFIEQNPFSLNAFSEIKPIEKLLDSKEYLPVIVTMSTSPSSFVTRPYQNGSSFAVFMDKLQLIFKKYQVLLPKIVEVGDTYAALSHDEKYYRVTVEEVLNSAEVCVFFCDFGDVMVLSKKELRCLPEIFRNVPKQAIRCTLWGVKPVYDKWSTNDCLRFQELTVDSKFFAIVKKMTFDKSLRDNRVLEVDLLDVSTHIDIFIRHILIREGRALTNYYSI